MEETEFWLVIDVSAKQQKNAWVLMEWTELWLWLSLIEKPLNAALAIFVIKCIIVIDANELQLVKVGSPVYG